MPCPEGLCSSQGGPRQLQGPLVELGHSCRSSRDLVRQGLEGGTPAAKSRASLCQAPPRCSTWHWCCLVPSKPWTVLQMSTFCSDSEWPALLNLSLLVGPSRGEQQAEGRQAHWA